MPKSVSTVRLSYGKTWDIRLLHVEIKRVHRLTGRQHSANLAIGLMTYHGVNFSFRAPIPSQPTCNSRSSRWRPD
jgi:hypothetical protein